MNMDIRQRGINRMLPEEKKELVVKYILPKARKFFREGRGESQVEEVTVKPSLTPKR